MTITSVSLNKFSKLENGVTTDQYNAVISGEDAIPSAGRKLVISLLDEKIAEAITNSITNLRGTPLQQYTFFSFISTPATTITTRSENLYLSTSYNLVQSSNPPKIAGTYNPITGQQIPDTSFFVGLWQSPDEKLEIIFSAKANRPILLVKRFSWRTVVEVAMLYLLPG
jgi:hypothetical protein